MKCQRWRVGRLFEAKVIRLCAVGKYSIVRIPDGCRRVYPDKLIQVKSPFDFVAADSYRTYFFDCKSNLNDRLPLTRIPPHQRDALVTLSRSPSVRAGLLVEYRRAEILAWVDIDLVIKRLGAGPKSIHYSETIHLNPNAIFEAIP